ncbi:transposase [Pseudoroseomonas ludipueritiae]|uniref:Transposase n=1 Tax=Pseudoroseomonas ludipueritiae TaxID=198093 RepID=A0ABR7R9M1_9PROT|nr:transposase [Pseudoroseomonas ludipueritiae]
MVDVNDDANGRRRRRSEEAKARIVEGTLVPGAVIAEVARRWQVCSQQVFTWRLEMRHNAPPSFLLIVAEPGAAPREPTSSPCIEIQVAGALVRVLPDKDPALFDGVPGQACRPDQDRALGMAVDWS